MNGYTQILKKDDFTRLTSCCLEIHIFTGLTHSASHCGRKSAKQWRICDFRRVCYIQFHGNGTRIQQKARQTKATVALYSVLALLCPTEIGAFCTVCSCCPFSAEHLAAYRIMTYSWEMWGPTNHLTLALVRYRLYERWINEAWRRNWAHKKYRRQSWKQREEEKHTRF